MSNLGKVLRDEIARLGRKEARAATRNMKKMQAEMRRSVAALRRELAAAQREIKRLAKIVSKGASATAPAAELDAAGRVTAKGVRSMRRKLQFSRSTFGALVGATSQSVYNWENSRGPLRLREASRRALLRLRDMGKKEALAELARLGVRAGRNRRGRPPSE
ncbi:MAG: hypothetical protein FJ224_01460 [Lentisphaerae bacterium]|nr:hypothetical protein [Lentisphaerota bacterium]